MKNNESERKKIAERRHNSGDGPIGNPNGVDTDSTGYKKLREATIARSAAFTNEERHEIEFNSILPHDLSAFSPLSYSFTHNCKVADHRRIQRWLRTSP